MAEKHTSTLSSLYQQRKAHYVLPEETRKKINQQTKRKRRTTWRVAIPTVFASLLVLFVVWPNYFTPDTSSALTESDIQASDTALFEKPLLMSPQSEDSIAMESKVIAPDEPIAERPEARQFTVMEYSNTLMMDAAEEAEAFDLNEPTWLLVESVEPLVLKNCLNQQVDIELTNELTENQWIQIRADQTHWRIDQRQLTSPCDER